MFVELLQLLPDPFVLLSDKAVLSSSKAPKVFSCQDCVLLKVIVYNYCVFMSGLCYFENHCLHACVTPLLNHDQIASVQKVLMRTMVKRKYKKCGMLKNKLNLTGIAGNVAVRSSCMLSMLARCQNLQRCTFDVNLFV